MKITKKLNQLYLVAVLSLVFAISLSHADQTTNKLKHWDQQQRRIALQTIQSKNETYANSDTRDTISQMLKNDKNCGVRTLAAETLGSLSAHIEIEPVQDSLIAGLSDPIASVRIASLETLCFSSSNLRVPENIVAELQEDPDRQVRIRAKRCSSKQSL